MERRDKPAELLKGVVLDDGWEVVEPIKRSAGATGGAFSVPYLVERSERGQTTRAFLKALDLSSAFEMDLPIVDALNHLTETYIYERDLVMRCAGSRMKNVVLGLTYGQVTVNNAFVDASIAEVPYIIFEEADGDVRRFLELSDRLDDAILFRLLHGVANGLRQLHGADITHQDLKPSNVMTFASEAKIGDLGRASSGSGKGLFDDLVFAGDWTYAPPEYLYRHVLEDDRVRRRSSDMYQLGSLSVFLYTGVGMTGLLSAELDDTFHWRSWPNGYPKALPYVRDAFGRILVRLEGVVLDRVGSDAIAVIRQLCDPDPLVRGDARRGDGFQRYDMERFVSYFDRLARRAEMELQRG